MQIADGIHAIKIPFIIPLSEKITVERYVYSYVIGENKPCLIDSGVAGSEALIYGTLRRFGKSPAEIETLFLTHSHPDHIGAARAISNGSACTILAHPAGKEWIEDVDMQFAERPVPGFHTLVDGSVSIDRCMNDNELVNCGDAELQILFTPGHSECSLSIFHTQQGVLFSGDAIPQENDLPIYTDAADAVQSIRRLSQVKGITRVLSSWSDPLPDAAPYDIMERGIEYFQTMHACVRKVSGGNSTIDPMELCRRVVAEIGLPPFAVNPLVAQSLESHLRYIDLVSL